MLMKSVSHKCNIIDVYCLNRTTSTPNSVLHYDVDKGLYFVLEFNICCVFQPANACLRMCSHGWKQQKTLENYQKSTLFIVRTRLSRKAHVRTWRNIHNKHPPSLDIPNNHCCFNIKYWRNWWHKNHVVSSYC